MFAARTRNHVNHTHTPVSCRLMLLSASWVVAMVQLSPNSVVSLISHWCWCRPAAPATVILLTPPVVVEAVRFMAIFLVIFGNVI